MLRAAATAAAGHQSHPGATLYLVATPIGNRADITLRALHVLDRADTVACEDTRVTAQLLAHYGLDGKALLAVHAHNENEAAARVCQRLAAGEVVAFVSLSGTTGTDAPAPALPSGASVPALRRYPLAALISSRREASAQVLTTSSSPRVSSARRGRPTTRPRGQRAIRAIALAGQRRGIGKAMAT